MKPDWEVTAIITTLDNLPLLRRQVPICLEECGRVVVVVNGSEDGTKEWLLENPDERMTVHCRENLGAGPGRNAGLRLWDEHPTPYTLMLDGGILPIRRSVENMKVYLEANPDVDVISPEVASSFVTDETQADRIMVRDIRRENCFPQGCLSSTAYALCRASAWRVRFSEEGPFGKPGWGVDDNDMAFRWRDAGVLHHDFILPIHIYRHRGGSFKRLQDSTGVPANGYGSVYEMRNIKMWQDWPQYITPDGQLDVSIIIPAWNEYPMFARAVKVLHEDLKDIPHEIIVVNNGSDDRTRWWLDTFALRQPNGDATVDAETGDLLRRKEHPELEPIWTGNVVRVDFQENRGLARAVNAGFAKARGRYVGILDGDILPVKSVYAGFKKLLDELLIADWVGLNPWVITDDEAAAPKEWTGNFIEQVRPGAGEYLGGYCLMRREVIDAGCKFPEQWPFDNGGCGYEDADFANQFYSRGFRAWFYNVVAYYHQRRDKRRTGLDDVDKTWQLRSQYEQARWHGATLHCVHHHNQPPERHVRRVAVVCREVDPLHPGTGHFILWALRQVCEADLFIPGSEPDGYDDYFYLVDYEGAIRPKRPAVLWAVDMHVPREWQFSPPLEHFTDIAPGFDKVFAARPGAVEYFKEHGIKASYLPVAADPGLHHPVPVEAGLDWTAVWHNCGPRIELVEAVRRAFPNGLVAYSDGMAYSPAVCGARCALNRSRLGDLTMRVFETMAMGVPLVTDRVPELALHFAEGAHYLGYDSAEECVEKIRWVQEHPAEAGEMAARARALVMDRHTYVHRVLTLWDDR